MKSKVTKELLPCALTDTEVIKRADRLVKIAEESATLDWELEVRKKDHKEKQGGLTSEAKQLCREVKSRSEDRMVEVKETFYWERNSVERVRLDTGEIVSARSITADERQRQLELDEEKVKAVEEALAEKEEGAEEENAPAEKGLKAVR